MTATPRYFTSQLRQAAEGAEYELASMDDEARFGPLFSRLTFGEAIERQRPSRGAVVYRGKISWPTRGPNVDQTIASTMRREVGVGAKSACK
jgi:hypothetical protein